MNPRFARRLMRRFAYGLARPVLWAAALSAALFGVLVGWILFAEPHKLGSGDFGNVAEWFAAIGTWVIGWGAWSYARDGHLLRMQQLSDAAKAERRIRVTRLETMMLKALYGKRPHSALEVILEKDPKARNEGLVEFAFKNGLEQLKGMEWTETERASLDLPVAIQLTLVENKKKSWIQFVSIYMHNWNAGSAAVLNGEKNQCLEGHMPLAAKLKDESEKLFELLKAERGKLATNASNSS